MSRMVILASLAITTAVNLPGRMTVGGVPTKLFIFSVPGPERFVTEAPNMPFAETERGWPWSFETATGREFTTKEGYKMFLYEPAAPALRRLALPLLLMNVLCLVAPGVALAFVLRRFVAFVAVPVDRYDHAEQLQAGDAAGPSAGEDSLPPPP